MIARVRRSPQPFAVAAAVAVCAAWLAWRALRVESYVWIIDELLYAKVARFYSDGFHLAPQILGTTEPIPNTLYPLLLAPLYAFFGNVTAFELAHVLNALLFASTIVPVYLLGRRVLALPWGFALAAGVGSVLVPWAVAVNVVMTESLSYAAFMWAIYGMARAFAAPGWRSDLLALLLIGVAAWARVQFFLLVGVFVVAIVLHALAGANVRARLRPHVPLLALVAVGVVGVLVVRAAGFDPLGTYSGTVEQPKFPSGWWTASGRHLAHVVVGLAIAPVILFVAWLPRAIAAPASPGEHGFGLVAGLTFALIAYQVGFFTQAIAGGQYQERYVFYVAPLIVLGAMAALADRRRVPRATLALGAVAAVLMIGGADPPFPAGESESAFARIANASSAMNSKLELWIGTWSDRLLGDRWATIDGLALIALAMAVALGVLLHLARRRPVIAAVVAGAIVLVNALQINYLQPQSAVAINQSYPGVLPHVTTFARDWVDRAVPDDAKVGVVLGRHDVGNEEGQWQWHFFWNTSIVRAYQREGAPGFGDFQPQSLFTDATDGRLLGPRQDATHLVVSRKDPVMSVRGREIARVADGTAVVVPERPWRTDWLLDGEAGDERIHVYPRTGETAVAGELEVEVTVPDAELDGPLRVRLTGAGRSVVERRVAAGGRTVLRTRFEGDARATVRLETLNPGRTEEGPITAAVVRIAVRRDA